MDCQASCSRPRMRSPCRNCNVIPEEHLIATRSKRDASSKKRVATCSPSRARPSASTSSSEYKTLGFQGLAHNVSVGEVGEIRISHLGDFQGTNVRDCMEILVSPARIGKWVHRNIMILKILS